MRLAAIFLALAMLVAIASAQTSNAPADLVYAKPGTLADAGGFRLNLVCMGSGSPTVVFDSGWEDWAPAWSKVQPEVAKFTRACSYDRAGAGFSEAGPMPRTSVRIAGELHTALHNAHIKGPYILVASAFGGDNMRVFADQYMPEVAGLVMVDADPDEFEPAMSDTSRDMGIAADLRECRNAIAEHKPLPTSPARPGHPERTCAQQFFRGIPEAEWSPALNAKLLEIATTKVAMYDAYISEMEQTQWDIRYLQLHRGSFGARPIRVVTSGNHAVGHFESRPPDTPEHLAWEQQATNGQARWLELSSNSRQVFPRNSSEYIQFDAPEVVVGAIREVHDIANGKKAEPPLSAAGTGYRECFDCPEMVIVPAGRFTMGSSDAEKEWAAAHGGSKGAVSDEAPQHEVAVPSFALGRYDVTLAEYAAFVRATGHSTDGCGHGLGKWDKEAKWSWQDPGFAQTDRDPVVCVSWNDAQAYIAWLSKRTGHAYRLPSESEWEYAARAGTTTKFWWGDDDSEAAAHAWFRDNSGGEKATAPNPLKLYEFPGATHPVGLKPANPFGLYDIVGNVWQWTEDCYDNDYTGAPTDGRAKQTPSKDPKANDSQGRCLRVDRGGSWMFPAWLLRPATRERNPEDFGDPIMGFRVARSVP